MTLTFSPGKNMDSLGHHFIVGLSGTTLSDSDKRVLSKLKPAGILLLKRNFDHESSYDEWLLSLNNLLEQTKAYAERDKMLVSVDHEGRRVTRTPAPITVFPSAVKCAARAAEVAKAMAIELSSIGMNVSWAPVADIHSNPENPIIGDRAFGSSAAEAIEAIVPFTKALEENGILGCAKHFPGHGDTSTDSHLELPEVALTDRDLLNRELLPFKALVDSGISMVMTAHIMFQKIDTLYPATLSERILKDLLRDKLDFKGCVVSDDVEMKAVADLFQQVYTLSFAIKSGCDLIIVSRQDASDHEKALMHGKNLLEGLHNNKISENLLHDSFKRISKVFDKLKDNQVKKLDDAVFKKHKLLAEEIERGQ